MANVDIGVAKGLELASPDEKPEIQYWWIEHSSGMLDVARVVVRKETTALKAYIWSGEIEVYRDHDPQDYPKFIERIYPPNETKETSIDRFRRVLAEAKINVAEAKQMLKDE